MKPQLGRLASLLLALFFAIAGSGYTWFTLDTQHALNVNGITDTAEVTAVHHPTGRLTFDSIDVRLPRYPDEVEVDRFRGDPALGDQLRVRYDRNDPTRIAQEGVSLWGPFEFLALFVAAAGIVSTIIEIRRWPKRRRRGRPFQPTPRPDNGPEATTPWATKSRRNKRRTWRTPSRTRGRHSRLEQPQPRGSHQARQAAQSPHGRTTDRHSVGWGRTSSATNSESA